MRMKSISNKILRAVISGLIVVTIVISVIATNMMHEVLHKDADVILENVAQREAAYLNDALNDIKESVTIINHYLCSEIRDVRQLSDEEFLAEYTAKAEEMFTEVALNTTGATTFYLRFNPDYTHGTAGFFYRVLGEREVKKLFVTDLAEYDVNDTVNVGWYYKPIAAGGPVWLEPYKLTDYDVEVISYVVPLYKNEELIGVAGIDIAFSEIIERVENITLYENGHAVLLAPDGTTQYNGEDIAEYTDPHTASRVELKNGMYLELRAAYKDIQKDLSPMLKKIVAAFFVVLFFALLYTIVVIRRIIHPLRQLTEAAQELSARDFEGTYDKLTVRSDDEIGALSEVLKDAYERMYKYTSYINSLAFRDALTGGKNNTAYAKAAAEKEQAIHAGNPRFGVLVADINNLKAANDVYGHHIGDQLIISTAKILMDIFDPDSVFRVGGDEFAVILENKEYNHYQKLLAQFDKACSQYSLTVDGNKLDLFVACGVAFYNHETDQSFQDVFEKADLAMYLDKEKTKRGMRQKYTSSEKEESCF